MKNKERETWVAVMVVFVLAFSNAAVADTFGTGMSQFDINFVVIAGNASSANGTNISQYPLGDVACKTFIDPGDYRIGIYEITNDQWNKFISINGAVTGDPEYAYDVSSYWMDMNAPANNVSWLEAAQFVNWLNTTSGYHVAYKFTGTQGTVNYTFGIWSDSEAAGTNFYRHKDAFYFLPTEDEWVKAAYWNGTNLQNYATIDDSGPIAGVDTNHYQEYPGYGPWNVGSGSEELNGTFDMMGNVWEWMESPYPHVDFDGYVGDNDRGNRGGDYCSVGHDIRSSGRYCNDRTFENLNVGFRVASVVPEPCTVCLLGLGGLALVRKQSM